jgi:hypothetical protein
MLGLGLGLDIDIDIDIDNDIDLSNITQYGIAHLISVAHPDPIIAGQAAKREAELVTSSNLMCPEIAALRSEFRGNIKEITDKVTFSDGVTLCVTDDAIYDRRTCGSEADRKLAFLTSENLGYPQNINVLERLRNFTGIEWADRQAKEHGFKDAAEIRQLIEDYYTRSLPKYRSEAPVAPVAHWNRVPPARPQTGAVTHPLEVVFLAFCKLWNMLDGLSLSYSKDELWGYPVYKVTVSGTGTIIVDLFTRSGNKHRSGISFRVTDDVSYVSLPFEPASVLNGNQIVRLFGEMGHGVHHLLRSSDAKPILFQVPFTLMELCLQDSEVVKEIGLGEEPIGTPATGHSIMADICYSMFCLDFFSSTTPISMGEYYDKYFPGYTREGNELHTECNLPQVVNYQSAYYIYIIGDIIANKIKDQGYHGLHEFLRA